MKKVGGDGGRFQGSGGLFGVELNGADEEVDTGDEGTVQDDIVRRRMHDGWYESADGSVAEGCRHRKSEDEGT